MKTEKEMITVREFATYSRLTEQAVTKRIARTGRLPGVHQIIKIGRTYVILIDKVEDIPRLDNVPKAFNPELVRIPVLGPGIKKGRFYVDIFLDGVFKERCGRYVNTRAAKIMWPLHNKDVEFKQIRVHYSMERKNK